ncbi:hypothetical protein CHH58_13380 [Terribacillus saccharophilus]|uniref:DUF2712 domain-containing protein n=1 Tax=Terribacillus saccharophilus TaxID=361277 RepID=UPI000BA5B0F3|nr:DUF2712 domain-containing protein [Terribacillus saccharophilus]PAF36237.1 hypothetical protein CHH58_13380 [Terribacillus saccharophilus]
MKKSTRKKITSLALATGIASAIIVPNTPSFAADNNVGYNFLITQFQQNNYAASRYRQTKSVDNKWKVKMTYSDESGGKTYTRFWLSGFPVSKNVSSTVNVLEDHDAYYRKPYEEANQADVRLTAENNNFSNTVYNAEGYWDEETW